MIELEKDPALPGLGISLTGNKDGSRARMSVYVADIDPQGPAGLDGRIRAGDELLEVQYGGEEIDAVWGNEGLTDKSFFSSQGWCWRERQNTRVKGAVGCR